MKAFIKYVKRMIAKICKREESPFMLWNDPERARLAREILDDLKDK